MALAEGTTSVRVPKPKPPKPSSNALALAEHIALQNPRSGLSPQSVLNASPSYEPERPNASLASYMPSMPAYSGVAPIINAYLAAQDSPLAGLGRTFAKKSKKWGLDPRLLVAIAGAETSLMKDPNAAPMSEHNAWGMGPGIQYPSWRAGIEATASNLAQNYLSEGRNTIEEISSKWAPIGASNDPAGVNSNWVSNVRSYWDQLTRAGIKGGKYRQKIPKWAGGQQLIYDPKGSWFRGMDAVRPGAYGGHEGHIHAAFSNPRAMLKTLRVGTKHGLDFGENPYTGQVYPVHAGQSAEFNDFQGTGSPSWHYRVFPGRWGPDNRRLGSAWDITDPDPNEGWDLGRMFDFLAARMTGTPNYDYGTAQSSGGFARAATDQDIAQQQAAAEQLNATGRAISQAAFGDAPGFRRRKKRSGRSTQVDDLINALMGIEAGTR